MDLIKNLYREAFREHGDSPKSVLWPKGRQEERFAIHTRFIDQGKDCFSVLDFGCGLAHLKPFLEQHFHNFTYTGVDLVDEFLDHNRKKYPTDTFFHIDEFPAELKYDFVISSGAFNIMYSSSEQEHMIRVRNILGDLFRRANVFLSVDFMTNLVDFQQPGAFHVNPAHMADYFLQNFSRRTLFDHSYLPYEFSLTTFKDSSIKRPENIYENR